MSDFKDQQALSDGFPAQSGMISRNIREYGTQNPSPEIDGGGRIMGSGEAAKYVNRVVDARTREDHRAYVKRTRDFYRELEPTLSEDQVREMAMRDVSGESAQEAIDDLQRRVSDRDVMMDGFPAQSGMIYEGMMPTSERRRLRLSPMGRSIPEFQRMDRKLRR